MEEKGKKIRKRLESKGLWVESVIDGGAEHLFIGKREDKYGRKVHIILDTRTGEIRIDKSDKTPHDLIEKVDTILTLKTGEKIRSTRGSLEFIDGAGGSRKSIPILDIFPPLGISGGPNGHFVTFIIKNISTETAIECQWFLRGFGYEYVASVLDSITLQPNDYRSFEYKISDEKPFRETTSELNIVMQYKNLFGDSFFTRRDLIQVRVPSGDFFNLKLEKFHPPEKIVDYGIKFISSPYVNGDRYEGKFEIEFNGERKIIKIGISRTLLAMWGFSTDDDIKGVIVELGSRKVRKMLIDKSISDYIFTTASYSTSENRSGFTGYQLLRDSL